MEFRLDADTELSKPEATELLAATGAKAGATGAFCIWPRACRTFPVPHVHRDFCKASTLLKASEVRSQVCNLLRHFLTPYRMQRTRFDTM